MQAMIFAAGLGTRLKPLTDHTPKALVKVGGKPLLEHVILRLMQAGVQRIIVNVHHFADQVEAFLASKDHFGIEIHISDERDLLRETGGGLKHARPFIKDSPLILHNADILTDIDLQALYTYHVAQGGLATLAVRQRETSRYLLFDEKKRLKGWENKKTGAERLMGIPRTDLEAWAFSGIHVIDPQLFQYMPEEEKFSIIEVYLACAAEQEIYAFTHTETEWLDVGKLHSLEAAEALILRLEEKIAP